MKYLLGRVLGSVLAAFALAFFAIGVCWFRLE